MERSHYTIRVTGKVQGVWYRQGTVDQARTLGLTGTARNLPDGSVLIEAEGPREALEQLLAWCRLGPPLAVVQEVTHEEAPVHGYDGFHIAR